MVGEQWRGLERMRVISFRDKGIITAKQIRTKETNLITSCFLRFSLLQVQRQRFFETFCQSFDILQKRISEPWKILNMFPGSVSYFTIFTDKNNNSKCVCIYAIFLLHLWRIFHHLIFSSRSRLCLRSISKAANSIFSTLLLLLLLLLLTSSLKNVLSNIWNLTW